MNNFFFVVAFKRNIFIRAHTSSAINLNLCLQIMGYLYSHATIPSTLDYWTPGASTHAARRITNKLLTDNFRSSSARLPARAQNTFIKFCWKRSHLEISNSSKFIGKSAYRCCHRHRRLAFHKYLSFNKKNRIYTKTHYLYNVF